LGIIEVPGWTPWGGQVPEGNARVQQKSAHDGRKTGKRNREEEGTREKVLSPVEGGRAS